MAAIDISSTAVPLNDGILQLQNGVAMDATLRNVTDISNTTSPLKLSTTLVQVDSTLSVNSGANIAANFIGNNSVSNFKSEIAIGDASNSRGFTIGIDPFGTGNDVLYFYDAKTTHLPVAIKDETLIIGNFDITLPVGMDTSTGLYMRVVKQAIFRTSGGNPLLKLETDGTTQLGNETAMNARLGIKGLGATSATTSLLIQNSASNSALTIKDDLTSTFGGSVSVGATIVASAILQADSTTKGFLPPRMTTTQINAIVSPAEGLVAFNTTISHLCCYQAGAWVKFNHSPM